jgi:phage terminase large subunit
MDVYLPNNWKPRPYQMPTWKHFENGGLRALNVWHRRSGKDDVAMNITAVKGIQRPANYWYMLPESSQGRKAVWDAISPHTGQRRIDQVFPHTIRRRTVDNEMKIELINGAIWQVLGSDNFNSYMGAPPAGVVFSEWALSNPQAWSYIQPMLEENGGWALFNTTPRGRNHAADFYDMAMNNPKTWFCDRLGADKTGVFTPAQLESIRKELIDLFGHQEGNARFQQEYFVSFDSALPGAYYGQEMNNAESEGRISGVPYDPGHLVFPCFDFGRGQTNSTAVGFMQLVGLEPRCIDYHEDNTGKIEGFGKLLREKPYTYGSLILPHDAGPVRLATGLSYEEQFQQMGFRTRVLPVTPSLSTDINLTRQFITMTWFDKRKCGRLIECLRSYHREWDTKAKVFKPSPKHDWSSHGADMFRQAAVAHKTGLLSHDGEIPEHDTDYSTDFDNAERSSISGY